MKSILVTVMLIMVVIVIYNSAIGGNTGTRKQVNNSGAKINGTIERIDP
ncbi:hypothetical protein [Paenibacillus aceris]|uniref:Uncharacterized protein n=1 Tax=Paenibacillus aceris TaxID=869555 RepID=A0ABS4I843_9BACL|nr:hypothetical protein [Paenibacillus aceris]MBP1966860.1 hypothetical protein [Paenibacillus aceris]NHW38931.1 hypothetical protein [Paenibacillus aceris]